MAHWVYVGGAKLRKTARTAGRGKGMREHQYYVCITTANTFTRIEGYYADFHSALHWTRFRATHGFPCWYIKRLRDGVIIAQSREG